MLKTDEVTCTLLYSMGADISSINSKLTESEMTLFMQDEHMNSMRMFCKVRSAIMLRGHRPTIPDNYPLQSKICPKELFEQAVEYLKPVTGYIKSTDFTNPGLYNVFTACNQELYRLIDIISEQYTYLTPHKFIIQRFVVNKRKITFTEFITELSSLTSSQISIPWGIYMPLWQKLYQDNKQTFNKLFTSDTIFLPKVYYSTGRHYDSEKWVTGTFDNYTDAMKRVINTIKSSRNVSVVIDGDNVPPTIMVTVMKFMSTLRNVKAIKVVYNDDGLIRWEHIYIDKVSYYKSHRYQSTKNNTDLIVGAILMEEQYKGASTTILISSDGDYINVIDMIQHSDVIVLLPNQTSQAYVNDLDSRGIQTEVLTSLFHEDQIMDIVGQDRRFNSLFILPTK